PGSMLSLGINKKFWDSLSKSDQLTIEAAALMENDIMMAEYNAKNGESLAKLIKEQGVQLRRFNDDIYDSFGEAAESVFADVRTHGDLAKRIDDSFVKTRRDVGAWAKISDQAYVEQRNRVLKI
ncbi:MAG: ABC transporter substrate-binding protein, partial [Gammaproteobacteria bacterium]|nr:ABC transporter substrate-binding protein [Gammaproteobacteria bacterium]